MNQNCKICLQIWLEFMTSLLWRNYTHFDGFEFIEAVTLPFSSRFYTTHWTILCKQVDILPTYCSRYILFIRRIQHTQFAERNYTFFLDCCEKLISYRQIVLDLTAFPPMSDQDDFEEVPRTRPASSRGQMPRNMSMNSLAKYLANSAEIDGLRSALKSGWNDYKWYTSLKDSHPSLSQEVLGHCQVIIWIEHKNQNRTPKTSKMQNAWMRNLMIPSTMSSTSWVSLFHIIIQKNSQKWNSKDSFRRQFEMD